MAINSISDAFQWARLSADSTLFTRKAIYAVLLAGIAGGGLTIYSKVEQTKSALRTKKYKKYSVPKRVRKKSPFAPKTERRAKRPPEHLVKTAQRMLANFEARKGKK